MEHVKKEKIVKIVPGIVGNGLENQEGIIVVMVELRFPRWSMKSMTMHGFKDVIELPVLEVGSTVIPRIMPNVILAS